MIPAASMMKTTNLLSPFLSLGGAVVALLLGASVPLARGQGETGELCCVCFDDCVSTTTNPDALFPIPENDEPLLEGITEAPCEQIRSVAEDLQLIPPQLCPLLDNEEFRQICGCENALAPSTPAPVASSNTRSSTV